MPRSDKHIQASLGGSKGFVSYQHVSPSPTFLHAGCSLVRRPRASRLTQHCSLGCSRLIAAAANKHCGVHGPAIEGGRCKAGVLDSGQPVSGVVKVTACSCDKLLLAANRQFSPAKQQPWYRCRSLSRSYIAYAYAQFENPTQVHSRFRNQASFDFLTFLVRARRSFIHSQWLSRRLVGTARSTTLSMTSLTSKT